MAAKEAKLEEVKASLKRANPLCPTDFPPEPGARTELPGGEPDADDGMLGQAIVSV